MKIEDCRFQRRCHANSLIITPARASQSVRLVPLFAIHRRRPLKKMVWFDAYLCLE